MEYQGRVKLRSRRSGGDLVRTGPWDWGGWLLVPLTMLVLWGGLIAVAVWAFL
jgi:hypothetical protein